MTLFQFAGLFFVLLCSGWMTGSPARGASGLPNVLVIVSDDQRADTVAALGNPLIETPNLDQLVRRGTSFTRATCGFPLCVPSRAEILTGTTAFQNGVPYAGRAIRSECALWGDAMRDAGYRTWYCGKWMNDGQPKTRGYDETAALFSSGGAGKAGRQPRYGRFGRLITGYRGWTFKRDDGTPELDKGIGLTGETSRHIADGAVRLLKRSLDQPFFLHVNFTAPHDPLIIPPGYEGKYDPADVPLPKNFRDEHPFDHGNLRGRDEQLLPWPRTETDVRREIAAYYAVIEDMDAQIGRILRALRESGREDQTVVIFTSDHGLALGSHGLMGKQNMYEHTIGIPLIAAGPGVRPNHRTDAQVHLRDLFPTTCELAGIDIPDSVTATSFAGVLRGESDQGHPAVFGYFYDFQRMIRTERWKLIHYPQAGRTQLFDLNRDPDELNDLSQSSRHAQIRSDLRRRLDEWFAAQGKP